MPGRASETPRDMLVMRLKEPGGQDAFEAGRSAIPAPSAGEFLVRVKACGVCGHDALARQGKLSAGKGDVLGHEIAGVVDSVGSEELADWLGERVALVQRRPCGACGDCLAGNTNQCRTGPGFYGDDIQGGYAEFVLADPLNAVRLPPSIEFTAAALLTCGFGTGFRALRSAKLAAGDVVVITGAGGGVGLHAVQLGAVSGYRVIATTTDAAKVQAIRQAGASEVLVSPSVKELRSAAATQGRQRGADAVLEITGAPCFATSLRALGPGGRLVLIGNVRPEPLQVDPGLVIVKELQILGSAHATREDLAELVGMLGAEKIHSIVAQTFKLTEVAQAHAALEARSLVGRGVVVP